MPSKVWAECLQAAEGEAISRTLIILLHVKGGSEGKQGRRERKGEKFKVLLRLFISHTALCNFVLSGSVSLCVRDCFSCMFVMWFSIAYGNL